MTSYGFFAVLDRLAIPFVVFAVAPVAFSRSEDRLLLMRTLALMGIYLGITAFFELFGPQSRGAPVHPGPFRRNPVRLRRGLFAESEANGLTLAVTFWVPCGRPGEHRVAVAAHCGALAAPVGPRRPPGD